MLSRFLFFSIFLIICLKGHTTTYYFSSSSGLDSRSIHQVQNSATPWQSIEKLNSIAHTFKPGDSILFKSDDTFYGTLTLLRSGTPKAPIYFGNYGEGKKPILTGLISISSWISSKRENVYEANVSDLNNLISILSIDGDLQPMGRFPNEKANNSGYITIQSSENGNLIGNLPQSSIVYNGGEIVIRKNNWILDRHLITSNSGKSISYDTSGGNKTPLKGYGFFIQNHISTLDEHGEWFFDHENKKLYIYYLGNPSSGNIKISTINNLINIHNSASYLSFQNLSIEGSNDNLINIYGSTKLLFENCNLEYIGKNAINSSLSKTLIIKNSTIKNALNGGIFLGWRDEGMIFQNNNFENIFNFAGMGQNGEMQGQAIYMSETSLNALIETNRFKKCGYNVINFNGNNVTVKNNLIDTFCFIKDDGAGIYTFTGSANTEFRNRKIFGNIIINGLGAASGTKKNDPLELPAVEGIYLDENASGVEITGNTIFNVKSKGIFLNHARNSIITNNKVINTGYSIYIANDKSNGLVENIEVSNNVLFALNDMQLHFSIRSRSEDLSLIGSFNHNIFITPKNTSKTIYVQTPTLNERITLLTWKTTYGMDQNSSFRHNEYSNPPQSEEFSSRPENSLFFDYNFSDSVKTVSLSGTYIDIEGLKVAGKINIPPYSTMILLKVKNNP